MTVLDCILFGDWLGRFSAGQQAYFIPQCPPVTGQPCSTLRVKVKSCKPGGQSVNGLPLYELGDSLSGRSCTSKGLPLMKYYSVISGGDSIRRLVAVLLTSLLPDSLPLPLSLSLPGR